MNCFAEWESSPRKIVVCAHTAPFLDGLLVHRALDGLAIPHLVYARGLFGLGPSWCQEINREAGRGFVAAEAARLSALKEFCAVIFPSGGTVKWKTGFYYLAKATGATVFVVGIDYNGPRASVVVDCALYPETGSADEIVAAAKARLARYAPFPLYAPLRVLFGYGDEAHDIAPWKLWSARGIFLVVLAISFRM